MSKTEVELVIEGDHASVTFFSEKGINVLSTDVLHELESAASEIAQAGVRSAVFQSRGKVFVAGADIKQMDGFTEAQGKKYGELGHRVFDAIEGLPCITVAAINGAALGGGMELALSCDFRVAVKHAQLGLPEVTLGLVPGWGGIPRLTELIGPSRAKRLFLSGLPVSAADAVDFGLVDEIVNSAEDLEARVPALINSFKRAAPAAVRLAKQGFQTGDDIAAFAACFNEPDAKEGIEAFVSKRPARWMEE